MAVWLPDSLYLPFFFDVLMVWVMVVRGCRLAVEGFTKRPDTAERWTFRVAMVFTSFLLFHTILHTPGGIAK